MNTKDLEEVLSGLRKVYPFLKSESAKKRLVDTANRIKKIIEEEKEADELYKEAEVIFSEKKEE